MRGHRRHGGAIATLATLVLAFPVAAHEGGGVAGGFLAGALHPVEGPDHLLAMVAVGLWGAVLGRPLVVILPVVFPAVMAMGGVLGMLNVPAPPVELGIALSVVLLGAVVAAALKAPVWAASLLVAVFALFHGYAHGQELPQSADPIGYSAGFVLATGALHVAGIAIGFLLERGRVGALAVRGLGGVIALVGVWFVYSAVASA